MSPQARHWRRRDALFKRKHRRERMRSRELKKAAWLALATALFAASPARADDPKLDAIETIIVLYAENRSFDNLYGLFPGANGLANATAAQYTQVDHAGKPLAHLPPVWKGSTAEADAAFPTDLPNRPYQIDAPPIKLPLSV